MITHHCISSIGPVMHRALRRRVPVKVEPPMSTILGFYAYLGLKKFLQTIFRGKEEGQRPPPHEKWNFIVMHDLVMILNGQDPRMLDWWFYLNREGTGTRLQSSKLKVVVRR